MAELTLRQRALGALSRREHSRSELARKLASHAESREQLDALLDRLEQEKLLSAARFAESLTHRREARFGSQRIRMELKQHGLEPHLVEERMAALVATELDRCRNVWEKKFGAPPASREERARQIRFLSGRGFSGECIRKLFEGLSR